MKGFSLVELLVAMGISLSLIASALVIVNGLQLGFASEGERADMQQRLRVATGALMRDLAMAGAGAYQGAYAGPLHFFIASVLPFRQGAMRADPAGTFKTDVLSILHVPPVAAAQTTISQPMAAQSGSIAVNFDAGCPADPTCGFAAGMDVMIYDETASYDTYRVLALQPGSLQLQHSMPDTPHVYEIGSKIVEAASHTYFLKADTATDTYQLVHYDGVNSEAAVADHVVAMAFEYYGEPSPPLLVKPLTDPVGPWTTYGPRPPPLDVQKSQYAAGENCAFQLDPSGLAQVPRLADLGPAGQTTLVRLTQSQLTDGPWCPDAISPNRYDADLLRVRKIAVTLRFEAPRALRGPTGLLFSRGGTSRDVARWVPDREVRFDVAPRNLNVGR
jgi:prepilin-type N-terminal cleavage/methylation domain-containing protein